MQFSKKQISKNLIYKLIKNAAELCPETYFIPIFVIKNPDLVLRSLEKRIKIKLLELIIQQSAANVDDSSIYVKKGFSRKK